MPTPIRAPEHGYSDHHIVVRVTAFEYKLLARMAGLRLTPEGYIRPSGQLGVGTLAAWVRSRLGLLERRPKPPGRRKRPKGKP